jgi:hypothetical protein
MALITRLRQGYGVSAELHGAVKPQPKVLTTNEHQ